MGIPSILYERSILAGPVNWSDQAQAPWLRQGAFSPQRHKEHKGEEKSLAERPSCQRLIPAVEKGC
jgi:hypothetical protein